jgi:hypothetical protein
MDQHLRRPLLLLLILTILMGFAAPIARAQSYALMVYNDPSYAGSWCYSNSPMTANIAASCNDQISSVQLFSGWSIRVYRDQNESGPSVCLNRSDPNLSDNTFEDGSALDNAISSFILYNQAWCAGGPMPAYPLEVYNDPGYSGSWCYSPNAETADVYSSCNDLISSVLLRSGWSIRFYRDPGQNGPSACLTASDPDLTDNTFDGGGSLNDSVSSFALYNQPGCPLIDPVPVPTYPLEVYTNSHYTGSRCFSPGAETANIYVTCNDQISSLLLQPGWSVRLYRDPNNGGPSVCLNTSDNNLGDNTFEDGSPLNDAVSSFTLANQTGCPAVLPPATYPLQVYTGANYTEIRCFSLVAEVANIYATCNDRVSSLRLQPGWSIRLYRDANQSGPSACLTTSDPDLSDNTYDGGGSLNESVSSFALYQQPGCPAGPAPVSHPLEVFNDQNYSGWWCYASAPSVANIHVSCADRISSLRLQPGWSIRLYRDANQSGPSACLTASDPNLSNNTFSDGSSLNDAISSFALYHQASCPAQITDPNPTPIPTPGAPLTVEYFKVDSSALWRNCYYVRVTLRNHTDQPLTQLISVQERSAFFTETHEVTTLNGREDRARLCNTGTQWWNGGISTIEKTVTIPAKSDQSFYLLVSHDWDWIERRTVESVLWDELKGAILDELADWTGHKLVDILKDAYNLSEFVRDVKDAIGAAPVARYTYAITTPGLSAQETNIWVEVPAINQGYLRGSIVDAMIDQTCGLGSVIPIFSIPCYMAKGSAIGFYFSNILH